MKKLFTLFFVFQALFLNSQAGTSVMSGGAQQAMIDFGNKTYRKSQPLNAVSYTHLTLPTTD